MMAIQSALESRHYAHLIAEGFTEDDIQQLEIWGVESLTLHQATAKNVKKHVDGRYVSSSGLWFPFNGNYGQLRLDAPIPDAKKGKNLKYLGPTGVSVTSWHPPGRGYHAITEGWKDAAMPTVRGVPTAAIAGVGNIIYSIPQNCEKPIIFDSDGWHNPQVVMALIVGALWTNGKINLFPEMSGHPTGGACEFFRLGGTIDDYQKLIDDALTPEQFIERWVSHWAEFEDPRLKIECASASMLSLERLKHANKFVSVLEAKVRDKVGDDDLFDVRVTD